MLCTGHLLGQGDTHLKDKSLLSSSSQSRRAKTACFPLTHILNPFQFTSLFYKKAIWSSEESHKVRGPGSVWSPCSFQDALQPARNRSFLQSGRYLVGRPRPRQCGFSRCLLLLGPQAPSLGQGPLLGQRTAGPQAGLHSCFSYWGWRKPQA